MTEIETVSAPLNEEEDKDEEEMSVYSDPNGKLAKIKVYVPKNYVAVCS